MISRQSGDLEGLAPRAEPPPCQLASLGYITAHAKCPCWSSPLLPNCRSAVAERRFQLDYYAPNTLGCAGLSREIKQALKDAMRTVVNGLAQEADFVTRVEVR